MRVYEYSASTQKILCSIIDFLYSIQTFFFFFWHGVLLSPLVFFFLFGFQTSKAELLN